MTDLAVKPRTLLPAVCRGFQRPHAPILRIERKSKRRSFASHVWKCSGPPPCEACAVSKSECSFEPFTDKRRKLTLRVAQKDADNYRRISAYIISILRSGKEEDVNILVKRMRKASSLDFALTDLQLLVSQTK
ncbi:hypothetical protein BDV37DRAFT_289169 [Aspergillus pseudonomiae]|uniref:Zn(2)-C6 fungal-type domain-containing protein n=1 Tax=Aspergillus pseudonomiae TaxID=1506151 RepID=A0A5N7CU62_9EURO|nr:uncharacterized protein BDV37DRAFT_289169 [Aspergillus pseudonomiae]KAE8397712.1 hypothetical protein BDV37DRAFT_289169 [Aspergillus pseudonomiae]